MAEDRAEIQELTLEDVMGERFGRYSKYIIQERALPDLRDGLKPVQRRILYAMYSEGNTYDKAFRKSAKTVGNVIGNYHPHGDTSVYDAMVRLSQIWKMREPLVDMHGNNGSMDGDPPAAMRYTEAKLSKIANELLTDIDKETVEMVLNFDDTVNEPTVLPANFPNLLVNGATGISAGYATDIPPHNLNEVIEATIHLIDHPDASTKNLMKYIKGPDFPTGGIVQGLKGLQKAYETGKGKIIIRAKTNIEQVRGGKEQIVISELPYEVNKASLVRKMDDIRINKKIDGISEVRDETDRTGLRIVIDLKKDAQADGILTYLLKNTDLQVTYNLNMIAIDKKRPKQVSIKQILQSYLDHRRSVVSNRTTYLLRKAEHRFHIVEGLIKAISILDKVIAIIRASENKSDAKNNLVREFQFSEAQAEAIVSLQLYRLTNTDITELQAEKEKLNQQITEYKEVLSNSAKLDQVVQEELSEVQSRFKSKRLTKVEKEIEDLKVEKEVLISQEQVMVTITKQAYMKRTSMRSFKASEPEEIGLKEGDQVIFAKEMSTLAQLLIFTNKGNVINRSVHELPDIKWKDAGHHLSSEITLVDQEEILEVFPIDGSLSEDIYYVLASRKGQIKQTKETEFAPKRTYKSRSAQAMKLKGNDDRVVFVSRVFSDQAYSVFLAGHQAYGLKYDLGEVSRVGANASGVKSMNLGKSDYVAGGCVFAKDTSHHPFILVSQRGAIKKINLADFEDSSRGNRGLKIFKELKTNPHRVNVAIQQINEADQYEIITDQERTVKIVGNQVKIGDRYHNGSFILDEATDGEPISIRRELSQVIELEETEEKN